MARTQKPEPKEIPPASSSSEEEEEESEESSDEEDSPQPSTVEKVQPPANEKEDEEDEEEEEVDESSGSGETESDSEVEAEAEFETPLQSSMKPKSVPLKAEGISSPKITATPSSSREHTLVVAKSAKNKRSPGADEKHAERDSKKARKDKGVAEKSADDGKEVKKPPHQRLWSDNDELTILRRMVDYYEENERSPTNNLADFIEFVRGSLNIEVNRSQIQDKIRRLKKKYEINKQLKKPSTDHERQLFNLSAKLWGSNGGFLSSGASGSKSKSGGISIKSKDRPTTSIVAANDRKNVSKLPNGNPNPENGNIRSLAKPEPAIEVEARSCSDEFIRSVMTTVGFSDSFVTIGLEKMSESQKSDWGERLKKFYADEAKLNLKKLALTNDMAKAMTESVE